MLPSLAALRAGALGTAAADDAESPLQKFKDACEMATATIVELERDTQGQRESQRLPAEAVATILGIMRGPLIDAAAELGEMDASARATCTPQLVDLQERAKEILDFYSGR